MESQPTPTIIRTPALLQFLTPCVFIEDFIDDENMRRDAIYSSDRSLNLMPDGRPLYCALSKTPPTSVQTPGKFVPSGYTRSGKYKAGRVVNQKTDKRAGK